MYFDQLLIAVKEKHSEILSEMEGLRENLRLSEATARAKDEELLRLTRLLLYAHARSEYLTSRVGTLPGLKHLMWESIPDRERIEWLGRAQNELADALHLPRVTTNSPADAHADEGRLCGSVTHPCEEEHATSCNGLGHAEPPLEQKVQNLLEWAASLEAKVKALESGKAEADPVARALADFKTFAREAAERFARLEAQVNLLNAETAIRTFRTPSSY